MIGPGSDKKSKLSQKPKLNHDGLKISCSGMKVYNGVAEENINTQNSSEKAKSKAEIDPLKLYVGNLPNNCTEGDLRNLARLLRYVFITHQPCLLVTIMCHLSPSSPL